METRRIVPVVKSNLIEETRKFYVGFLDFDLVMDMGWVITFASPSNPTAQISFTEDKGAFDNGHHSITIEVADVDRLYGKAQAMGLEITKTLTNEQWGVRRFFVKDPNGVTLNIMNHKTSQQ